MVGRKFIAIIAAMVAFGAALAVAGLYVDWQGMFAPPTAPQGPVVGESSPAAPVGPEAAPAGAEEPKPQAEATGALTPPAEPTSVPTFDVVVIEPSGEGVIAGRAAPGWKVSVQSAGTKVAEATADVQGEWSVVLEKPLPIGDHALSLKITSPDGARALTSQESVRVAVGAAENKGISPAGTEQALKPAEPLPPAAASNPANVPPQPAPQAEAAATPPAAEPEATRALTRAEQAASSPSPAGASESAAAPPQQKLVFKTVDYVDTGSGTGTVTITGTSDPGATISVYYDDKPLANVRADREGKWRVAVAKKLGMGQHNFSAERADAATGTLAGRAMVSIERVEPKPEPPKAPVVAAKPGTPPSPAAQVAGVEAGKGAMPGQTSGNATSGETYVIRRGDTLWAIAKRYLGSGLRYTTIFEDNRQVINDPNLIHPKQQVTVPKP